MNRLIKYEIRKAFCSRWFLITLVLCCLLTGAHAAETLMKYFGTLEYLFRDTEYSFPSSISCISLWIGCNGGWGSSTLQLAYYGVIFLAPLAYAWSSITEVESAYANNIVTRGKKSSYVLAKLLAVFLSSGCVVAVSYLLNLAILACVIPAFPPDVYDVFYVGVAEENVLAQLFYTSSVGYVIVRELIAFVVCGVWGMFICALGYLIKNRVLVFIVPFLLLLAINNVNSNIYNLLGEETMGYDLSIINFIQGVPSAQIQTLPVMGAVLGVVLLISLALGYKKMRADFV